MKIYVKGGITYSYWILNEDNDVLTTEQELGLIKEINTNTETLLGYVKTEDGVVPIYPVEIAPELYYILDDNDNAILADDTTGLIATRGLKRREFVIYSEDDNSLIFYASYENAPRTGSQYNNKTVTNVYTNFLDIEYTEDNLPKWHKICELIKSVSFDESFAKVKPSYTAYWFYGMINCTSINTENLDTSQVTNMRDMFSQLESIEELNVNNLDVRNVKTMYGIFYDCIKLITIDISNWQTNSLTNAHGMFDSCSGLITMDVSNLDTSKVTTMNKMFYKCSNLETIYSDDNNFVTTNVINDSNMFTNDTNLVGGNGTTYSSSHIDSSYAHVDVEGNPGYFTSMDAINSFAIYCETDNSLIFYTNNKVPIQGSTFKNKKVTYIYQGFENECATWIRSAIGSTIVWNHIRDEVKSVVVDETYSIIKPLYTACWFNQFTECTSIDLTYLDTSEVLDMSYMFYSCWDLSTLDVSSLNTSKVQNMDNMFCGCSDLTTIYSNDANFVTDALVDASEQTIFTCDLLVGGNGTKYDDNKQGYEMAHVDVEGNPGYFTDVFILYTAFAVYSVDDDSLTFYNDFFKNVPTEGSSFKGKTATEVYTGFEDTVYTEAPSVPWYSFRHVIESVSFDSSFKNVKPIVTAYWFDYFDNCTSIDLTYFDTSNVTDMQYMFYRCENLTSLDVSNFDTSNVTDMQYMFYHCSDLAIIYSNDANFVTTAVTSDTDMFTSCSFLIGGNGTKYDSSKVDSSMAHVDVEDNPGYFTDLYTAFAVYSEDDNSLTFYRDFSENVPTSGEKYNDKIVSYVYTNIENTGTLPDWHKIKNDIITVQFTSSFYNIMPTTLYMWFYQCYNCIEINGLQYLNTSKVTNMNFLFSQCYELTSLSGIENFNTQNVTQMQYVFWSCENVTELDVSNFDVRNVTTMYGMFLDCKSLEFLDLSNFATQNVTTMDQMFMGCNNLQIIYSDDNNFVTTNVINDSDMFTNDTNLVGGNGTTYSSSHIDSSYAHVDTSSNPGYFTSK